MRRVISVPDEALHVRLRQFQFVRLRRVDEGACRAELLRLFRYEKKIRKAFVIVVHFFFELLKKAVRNRFRRRFFVQRRECVCQSRVDAVGNGNFRRSDEGSERHEIRENLIPVMREEFFHEYFGSTSNFPHEVGFSLFCQDFRHSFRRNLFQGANPVMELPHVFFEVVLLIQRLIGVVTAFMKERPPISGTLSFFRFRRAPGKRRIPVMLSENVVGNAHGAFQEERYGERGSKRSVIVF